MNKFKEKLYRLMYGRYGIDELYKFSLLVFFVLWIAEIIAVAVIPDRGDLKAIIAGHSPGLVEQVAFVRRNPDKRG